MIFGSVSRNDVRLFTALCGFVVLLSYYFGVKKLSDPKKLWGGIPESWQRIQIPFILLAAFGYLVFWWVSLFQLGLSELNGLRWPWSDSDGQGLDRLMLAFAVFLIPSSLWMESTSFHVAKNYSWSPILVVGTLFVASIGNIMMGLLAYGAYVDGVQGSFIMLIGAVMISIQLILNDLFVWSWKFPWRPSISS